MLVRIDPGLQEPLFEQIAAELRRALAQGELEAGDRLAPARELADALGVNMHTVLRAYAALRDEGLVEMRRGRGVTVLDAPSSRARLVELARALLDEARRQGVDMKKLVALLKELR
jgi:DNA-binding transcriptional regulator YhcF (GntR family)